MHDIISTKTVSGITHPLVAEMYIKKGYAPYDIGNEIPAEDILVIETYFERSEDQDYASHSDSYLFDLLADLEDLKSKAQQQVGHFDRIDIRTH